MDYYLPYVYLKVYVDDLGLHSLSLIGLHGLLSLGGKDGAWAIWRATFLNPTRYQIIWPSDKVLLLTILLPIMGCTVLPITHACYAVGIRTQNLSLRLLSHNRLAEFVPET